MCHITQSPLKMLHWLAGPQNATFFIVDHPEETKALARIHEEKALALLQQVVDMPEAEIFFSGDNLDTMFYPPRFYRDYCQSFFSRAAEIIHRRGKRFVVHACGRNKKLLPLVGASGVDCLEGISAILSWVMRGVLRANPTLPSTAAWTRLIWSCMKTLRRRCMPTPASFLPAWVIGDISFSRRAV
jgi:hypothetical protein